MTATTKFYSGFFLALVLLVAISFYVGYRAGAHAHEPRSKTAHRSAQTTAP